MDIRLREAQLKILEAFAKQPDSFALAGGSALDLFYLNHRFSRALDFFSNIYDEKLNSLEVIRYLEREIERFIQEELL